MKSGATSNTTTIDNTSSAAMGTSEYRRYLLVQERYLPL